MVGLAIQLRQVKKSRLENEKLQLEIAELNAKAVASKQRVMQVTTAEAQRFVNRDVMFSLNVGDNKPYKKSHRERIKELTTNVIIILIVIVVIFYIVYDLFRLSIWLVGKL